MHTKPTHKPFFTSKDLFQITALAAINLFIALWLQKNHATIWSWDIVHLREGDDYGLEASIAFAQLFFFGLMIQHCLKIIITDINRASSKIYIPKILMQGISVLIYAFVALFGAIKLYNLPIKSLLAASGLVSVILAYAFRELISDFLASAQIQMNRFARIGDWIGYKHNEEIVTAKVVDLDQQSLTLLDASNITRVIRNSQFLQQSIINYSAHGNIAIRQTEIELSSRLPHTELLPILENALEYLNYSNKHFHGAHHARIKNLHQGNLIFKLEYRCHPSISSGESNHFAVDAALRFLKCAGFDLSPAQSESEFRTNHPVRVVHRLSLAKEFGVLKSLNDSEILKLQNSVQQITLEEHEFLLKAGELKDSIYIVTEGRLLVQIANNDENKPAVLAKVWPGDVLGEMSLLTGEPHSASIVSETRTSLLKIPKSDIELILKNNPYLTQDIVDQVLKLKQANEATLHQKVDQAERKNLLTRVFKFLGI